MAAKTFRSKSSCQTSSVSSSNFPRTADPALFTNMSIVPKSAETASCMAAICPASVTSQG